MRGSWPSFSGLQKILLGSNVNGWRGRWWNLTRCPALQMALPFFEESGSPNDIYLPKRLILPLIWLMDNFFLAGFHLKG